MAKAHLSHARHKLNEVVSGDVGTGSVDKGFPFFGAGSQLKGTFRLGYNLFNRRYAVTVPRRFADFGPL